MSDALARMKRFPHEPEAGTVIRFLKTWDQPFQPWAAADTTEYLYVAVRADNGRWYTTGTDNKEKVMTWSALLDLIGDSPCWIAESWTDVDGARLAE